MEPEEYFQKTGLISKKRYDALRAFFLDKKSAEQVADTYNYSLTAFYSLTRDFRAHLKESPEEDLFFKEVARGRKRNYRPDLNDMIIGLRKQNFSVEDVVGIINAKGYEVSYGFVYKLLNNEGFARLPRRSEQEKKALALPAIKAPVASSLAFIQERFHSGSTGVFIFLPFIKNYGIDRIIAHSAYPQTRDINRLSSILCFVALKLSNIKRYSDDDLWCMDRGLGLIAGLNVLPKSSWFSSYSSRVTKEMNRSFLRSLHQVWLSHGLVSDTANMDFTTVPYWGENKHLENNWSGKRNKALSSILTVLAQDPDNGIIDYGNCDVQHKNQSEVVLEYLDFYRQQGSKKQKINYLVFDSRFTNYENLSKLDDEKIKFITIRRRGKYTLSRIQEKKNDFRTIRVEAAGLKKRSLKVLDESITLRGYKDKQTGALKPIRQITITGNGKIKPALIITNDTELTTKEIVRKYARRWLVEKGISEQIEFFHLNRVCSSMVIKVDFDLTMTLLAHNLYRLLALELGRYSSFTAERIYEKFIVNNGAVEIAHNNIKVELKKKRDLPQIIEMMHQYEQLRYPWLGNRKLTFYPSATS